MFTPLLPAVNKVYRLSNYLRLAYYKRMTTRILGNTTSPVYFDSDSLFSRLQSTYPSRSNYFYDEYNSWKRGTERAQKILELGELQKPGLTVLEVACGDGMTGYALSHYGHNVTVNDVSDWRDPRAKELVYIEGNICEELALEDNSFDLVISYNSFEHLENPASAMAEICRLLKPNGLVILEFGPLYSSPWGMHAYRTIHMPYAQYLFSEKYLLQKYHELGLRDLGIEMTCLQHLNKWRVQEYLELWDNSRFVIIEQRLNSDFSHLGIVVKYKQSFYGRGLEIRDLVTQSISVIVRKKMANL